MLYDEKLRDMTARAVLYFKESDNSFTKVCDIKDINRVDPTSIPDRDDSMAYAEYFLNSQETYSIKTQMNDINKFFVDWYNKTNYICNIVCTTIRHQNRHHHKYRTNKKWAKRYGYTYVEVQDEPIIFMNDTIYCTKDALDNVIKKVCTNHTYK